MLNSKILKEQQDEMIKKGVKIEVNFPNMSPAEFGEKLLVIINYKSSHNDTYNIVDVRTYQGTDIIEITTYNEDAVMHLVKQLVDDYEQITVAEKLSIVDLSDTVIGYQMERLGLIREGEEVMIIGNL